MEPNPNLFTSREAGPFGQEPPLDYADTLTAKTPRLASGGLAWRLTLGAVFVMFLLAIAVALAVLLAAPAGAQPVPGWSPRQSATQPCWEDCELYSGNLWVGCEPVDCPPVPACPADEFCQPAWSCEEDCGVVEPPQDEVLVTVSHTVTRDDPKGTEWTAFSPPRSFTRWTIEGVHVFPADPSARGWGALAYTTTCGNAWQQGCVPAYLQCEQGGGKCRLRVFTGPDETPDDKPFEGESKSATATIKGWKPKNGGMVAWVIEGYADHVTATVTAQGFAPIIIRADARPLDVWDVSRFEGSNGNWNADRDLPWTIGTEFQAEWVTP